MIIKKDCFIKQGGMIVSLIFFVILLISLDPVFSASLPKSTQEMLKKLKLDPSFLAGIDKELQIPQEWVEKARKEGKVRVRGTPAVARFEKRFFAPFRERYPFISLEYTGGSQRDRAVKTLVAYKSGRIIGDLVENVAGALIMYMEFKAAVDLRNLPSWKNVPEEGRDSNGLWAGMTKNTWCMSYNIRFVKKEDLPKRWEDLLGNPKWRGGNLALANRPTQWALQLWHARGEKWTKDFLTKLFTEIKPQLRKEGINTLPQLVAAGEFHAVIPTMQPHAYELALQGAPVGYHCPEPVPATYGKSLILRGTPNLHATRIFMNWLLSKEGQLARYAIYSSTPAHKELQRKEFIPYAEEVLGKEVSSPDLPFEKKVVPNLIEFWNKLWLSGGSGK